MIKKNEILRINNLNVEFPLFGGILQREVSHVHAVKNLSLSVCEGETIGIALPILRVTKFGLTIKFTTLCLIPFVSLVT